MERLFLILPVANAIAREPDLHKTHLDINTVYNSRHPLPLNLSLAQQLKSHTFRKRCKYFEPDVVIETYKSGEWNFLSEGKNILVNSPCLGSDSLGNYLGSYFEMVSCAYLSGLHYLSVAKVYEPKSKYEASAFISHLPDYIEHKNPISTDLIRGALNTNCKCGNSCHEQSTAAWVKSLHIIRPIFVEALLYHLSHFSTTKNTTVTKSDISTELKGSVLPLIPDVAIHYRCGDNFIGHYGFLHFSVFKDKIPKTAETIYVLAEKRGRKTSGLPQRSLKCDEILSSLGIYLSRHFPLAKVVIKRGDDLYIDMARLSFAKTTICSVSTFCLWPAMVNNGTAYLPKSGLIVGGDISVALGYRWISSPPILNGESLIHMTPRSVVKKLGGEVVGNYTRMKLID